MTETNYPLRISTPILKAIKRLAEEDGITVDQFINSAVSAKLSAIGMDRVWWRGRTKPADVEAALAILNRAGGEPPRPGDELDPAPAKRRKRA